MSTYLKRYKLSLTIIGPMHIGSGEILGKKDYIFDRKTESIFYPSMHELFAQIKKKGLVEKYERFLLDRHGDLFRFLKENKISFRNWAGGAIAIHGGTDNRFNQIHLFVKDAYNQPYVPGSSIKGALRTVLLCQEARKDKNLFSPPVIKNMRRKELLQILRKEAKVIEQNMLYVLDRAKKGDALNDIMTAFRFSDSEPIIRESLTICRKYDAQPKTKNRQYRMQPKGLPTYRECLKPGTKINFYLTIDTSLLKDTPYEGFSVGDFRNILDNFNYDYDREFRDYFKNIGPNRPNTLYLGGGTGFLSKTILLGLLDSDDLLDFTADYLDICFPKHKHQEDKRLGVSPRTLKLTKYDGKFYEMGKCAFKVEEM